MNRNCEFLVSYNVVEKRLEKLAFTEFLISTYSYVQANKLITKRARNVSYSMVHNKIHKSSNSNKIIVCLRRNLVLNIPKKTISGSNNACAYERVTRDLKYYRGQGQVENKKNKLF